MQLVIVTGLSGSGKSVVLKALEDSGYYCICNKGFISSQDRKYCIGIAS